jgi:hypothetical protein
VAPVQRPIIAISNRIFSQARDLIDFAREIDCRAVDYSFPKSTATDQDVILDTPRLAEVVATGFQVRYHCPFSRVELAHADPDLARRSLQTLKTCVDVAADFGGAFITVHIGLGLKRIEELDFDTALRNLAALVGHGAGKGVRVCLENLTKGFTNQPDLWLELIEKTGAWATFDLGHANSCPWVAQGRGTSVEFLRAVLPRLHNAHVYEVERVDPATGEAYHVAPQDLRLIEPMLVELLGSGCAWWLIELTARREVELTRGLLLSFLERRGSGQG